MGWVKTDSIHDVDFHFDTDELLGIMPKNENPPLCSEARLCLFLVTGNGHSRVPSPT